MDPIVLRLRGVTTVRRDPDEVFRELHDPETILACVPGATLTRRVGRDGFEARVIFGAGPFRFARGGFGSIVDSDSRARTAAMAVTSRDDGSGPAMRVHTSMAVSSTGGGSEIRMSFRIAIADRHLAPGRAWLERIAAEMLERTIHRIKERLEQAPTEAPPAA